MTKHHFIIEGMHCNSCKVLVAEELADAGATHIEVVFDAQHKRGSASFESTLDHDDLVSRIEELGEYTVR